MRFRDWMNRFMSGRYGQDEFSRFLLPFGFVFFLAGYILMRKAVPAGAWFTVGRILYLIGFVAIFFNLIRTWSRNFEQRRRENEWFVSLKRKVLGRTKRDYKNYRYFSCPACKTMVRVPKGKGSIRITCPNCGETFIRKS